MSEKESRIYAGSGVSQTPMVIYKSYECLVQFSMYMRINFNLSVDKWNPVSEKGLPEDGEWCFLVWKTEDGEV